MISISSCKPKLLEQGLVGEPVDAGLVAAQVDRHAVGLLWFRAAISKRSRDVIVSRCDRHAEDLLELAVGVVDRDEAAWHSVRRHSLRPIIACRTVAVKRTSRAIFRGG